MFTTVLALLPELLISEFANRLPIEDTFRNGKQFLGSEEPLPWRGKGPERVAAVGYAIYSLVRSWFLKAGDRKSFPDRPWYPPSPGVKARAKSACLDPKSTGDALSRQPSRHALSGRTL